MFSVPHSNKECPSHEVTLPQSYKVGTAARAMFVVQKAAYLGGTVQTGSYSTD
jgi:hypothetical protein